MEARPILAVALFWGILGASGGQTAQAQTSGQIRFAQMILSKEANLVFKAQSAITRQNYDVQRVQVLSNGATSGSVRKLILMLTREINSLQAQINKTSRNLQQISPQALQATSPFSPANGLSQLAALNASITASIATRPINGIPAVTSSQ